MMFIKGIMIMIAAAFANNSFLQPISPGVYKETLEKVEHLVQGSEVWTKIELLGLENEINNVVTIGLSIFEMCKNSTFPDVACYSFRNLSLIVENTITEKYEKMIQERSRRGLINIIGSAAKFLFGTMDAEDSEKLSSKIQLLFDENGNTLNFKEKYTEIVEKSISRINATTDVVNHHSHVLNIIDNKLKALEVSQAGGREVNILIDLKHSYIIMTQALQNKIDGIHQMLIDLHNRVLNTRYVSYRDLIKALKNIKIEDLTLKWPFDLDKPSYETMRKLLKFSVFSSNSMLLVVFHVPFAEVQDYNFLKYYPVPKITENIGTFIDVNPGLIVADSKLEKFTTLTTFDRSINCVKVVTIWFCKGLSLMKTDKNSCIGVIMSESDGDLEKVCNVKVVAINQTLLIKTENDNTFLAFTGTPKQAKAVLKDSKTNLLFNGTQILSINERAIVKVANWEVNFYPKVLKTELEISVATDWISFPFNLKWESVSETLTEPTKNILLSTDFSDIGQDLEKLKNNIKKSTARKELERKNYFTTIMVLILSATALILPILCFIKKYFFIFKKLACCCKMITSSNDEEIELNDMRKNKNRNTR